MQLVSYKKRECTPVHEDSHVPVVIVHAVPRAVPGPLQAAFAAKLTKLIDSDDSGYNLWDFDSDDDFDAPSAIGCVPESWGSCNFCYY